MENCRLCNFGRLLATHAITLLAEKHTIKTIVSNIIQCQPKETERLSPGAKMASFWKDKDLPRIATVNAYVSVSSMDR